MIMFICSKGFEMSNTQGCHLNSLLKVKKKKKKLESTGHVNNTIFLIGFLLKVGVRVINYRGVYLKASVRESCS